MERYTTPPADSPTVTLRIGGRYRSHHRQTIYETVSFNDDGRWTVRNLDNGHEDTFEPNGRHWINGTTWSDLVEEVA